MVLVKYEACCPFCKTLHKGEIEMKYRKDNKFNVRYNNKNDHLCDNETCKKTFTVEIDCVGNVVAIPTKDAIKEGEFQWEKLVEGKIVKTINN
ncbi:MAG: hypothetical protein KAU95_01840 [Candidatus Aenigmarchaeota archaeon]|nr:hypothetical protein [Candidatus Aenigmarchaeota archaeon]